MTVKKIPRHKVFISCHDEDREYKRRIRQMMGDSVVDVSVDEDDIDDAGMATETISREIRDEYIRQASVTIVLIGPCTWQRMHVDLEIHFSIRDTDFNRRCGLLGILLPEHPDYGSEEYCDRLISARLADNIGGKNAYAELYDWPWKRPGRRDKVRQWIEEAFSRRMKIVPDSGRPLLQGNMGGSCLDGW